MFLRHFALATDAHAFESCVWFMLSFSSSQEDGGREGRTTTPPPLSPDPLISSLRLQTPCHRFWREQPLDVSAARKASKTRAVCLSALILVSLKKINKNTDSISKRDEPSTWRVLKHALLWEPTVQAGSLLNKTREGGNCASWHAFLNAFGCERLFLRAVEETVALCFARAGHRVTGSIANRDVITLTAKKNKTPEMWSVWWDKIDPCYQHFAIIWVCLLCFVYLVVFTADSVSMVCFKRDRIMPA